MQNSNKITQIYIGKLYISVEVISTKYLNQVVPLLIQVQKSTSNSSWVQPQSTILVACDFFPYLASNG